MTVYEEIKEVMQNYNTNDIVTFQEIRAILQERYDRNPGSVILSDYCYNRYNSGISFNKHLFEYLDGGNYKYLGENYNYTGPIYHKPKGQGAEIIVGQWQNGVKSLDSNKITSAEPNLDLILSFLDEYAGREYTTQTTSDTDKAEMQQIAQAGKDATNEFDKLVRFLNADSKYILTHNKKWLDGSNTKVRKYFWAELKKAGRQDSPTSISIFAENLDSDGARFRISLEMKETGSLKKEYQDHHRFLDMDISYAPVSLKYFSGGNNDGTLRELNITPDEIKQGLLNGSFHKIQLGIKFTHDDIELQGSGGMVQAIKALEPYYDSVFSTGGGSSMVDTPVIAEPNFESLTFAKNIILYGPPGTGKTYHSVIYAVAIIENKSLNQIISEPYSDVIKRYWTYKNTDKKIAFTTFHQSYGYEEFIEGIKPTLINDQDSDQPSLTYEIKPGLFKEFCDRAKNPVLETANNFGIRKNPAIWKVSLAAARENSVRRDCFNNNRIRIGWDEYGKDITDETVYKDGGRDVLDRFINQMSQGDIVFILYDERTIDAIGVINGEYKWLDDVDDYKRSRSVTWIVKDIREDIVELNGGKVLTLSSVYRLNRIHLSDVIEILKKHNVSMDTEKNQNNYVFIIDEINRGNISKIFGELITLIEPSKRLGAEESMTVCLPYSEETSFGVPANVYILGTMNTADRSIALLDTALRRRFHFSEMMPQPQLLKNINIEGINLEELLTTINNRIEVLYDREHTIGHAYFIDLIKEPTLVKLGDIFENAIIPLLQEYFYEDYSKIQLVLGDNDKPNEYKFIQDVEVKISKVFKGQPDIDIPEKIYRINSEAFSKKDAYTRIYL